MGRVELPAGGLQALIEVAQVASSPGPPAERARAMVAPLHRVVPFDAAWIGLLHPDRREHFSLVKHGLDDAVASYMDSPELLEDLESVGLYADRPVTRLRDLPVPATFRPWAEHLSPAGYRAGIGLGLSSSDGRHLGVLGLYLADSARPTDAELDLLVTAAPVIAAGVDPMRSLAAAAEIVPAAVGGAVLTAGGRALPLPGLPPHPLLADGAMLRAVLRAWPADAGSLRSFLCPYPLRGALATHLRVTVLGMPGGLPDYLTRAVVLSRPADLHGLTPRELQILGLLVEGWSNPHIAAELVITTHTVVTHVEHVLTKLTAGTRTMAAVRAMREGLYVPRPLLARLAARPGG